MNAPRSILEEVMGSGMPSGPRVALAIEAAIEIAELSRFVASCQGVPDVVVGVIGDRIERLANATLSSLHDQVATLEGISATVFAGRHVAVEDSHG